MFVLKIDAQELGGKRMLRMNWTHTLPLVLQYKRHKLFTLGATIVRLTTRDLS